MLDLFGNPEDWFSRDAAHMIIQGLNKLITTLAEHVSMHTAELP